MRDVEDLVLPKPQMILSGYMGGPAPLPPAAAPAAPPAAAAPPLAAAAAPEEDGNEENTPPELKAGKGKAPNSQLPDKVLKARQKGGAAKPAKAQPEPPAPEPQEEEEEEEEEGFAMTQAPMAAEVFNDSDLSDGDSAPGMAPEDPDKTVEYPLESLAQDDEMRDSPMPEGGDDDDDEEEEEEDAPKKPRKGGGAGGGYDEDIMAEPKAAEVKAKPKAAAKQAARSPAGKKEAEREKEQAKGEPKGGGGEDESEEEEELIPPGAAAAAVAKVSAAQKKAAANMVPDPLLEALGPAGKRKRSKGKLTHPNKKTAVAVAFDDSDISEGDEDDEPVEAEEVSSEGSDDDSISSNDDSDGDFGKRGRGGTRAKPPPPKKKKSGGEKEKFLPSNKSNATTKIRLPQGQKKKMWSEEEEDCVRKGVERYGAGKWADIKSYYSAQLEYRSSIQIKDKWRNMQKKAGV
ncbi:hypothetical protein TeGR_g5422 [Tetraparma gracilis]|uniref:Myb-like domain-containing protein n=1 Tax=Tetraparma gracilis TaxID=2962635 RepID=A0ABQ6M617_9STRA|nr:hypothetical protein TeGR_g5422 [Tetraparma gracilis]